jgi:hypothetical protein
MYIVQYIINFNSIVASKHNQILMVNDLKVYDILWTTKVNAGSKLDC